MRHFVALGLALLVLTGCGGSDDEAPVRDPDLIGTVTEVDGRLGGFAALVEAEPGVQQGRKVWATIGGDTARVGFSKSSDLAGQEVRVWIDGFCAESYPEQCAAEAIELPAH